MSDGPPTATFTVLAGPLKGTRVALEDAVDEIYIGSDPDCRLSLDLPEVSPLHARVFVDLAGGTVYDTHSPYGVYVNDDRVEREAPLRDGDILWLGDPAEPGSVMVQFTHRVAPAPDVTAEPTWAETVEPAPESVAPLDDPDVPAAAEDVPVADATEEEEDPLVVVLDDSAPEVIAAPAETAPAARSDDFFVDEPSPARAGDDEVEFVVMDDDAPPPPAADAFPFAFADDAAPTAPLADAPAATDDVFFVADEDPEPLPPAVDAVPPSPVTAASAPPVETRPIPPPPALEVPASHPWPAAVTEAPPPAQRAPATAPVATELHFEPPPPSARAAVGTGSRGRLLRYAGLGLVLLALVAAGGFAALRFLGGPKLRGADPARIRMGDRLLLRGERFASEVGGNEVVFGGQHRARVLQASATQLQVEVPEGAPAGRVPVTVAVSGRTSAPVEVVIYEAPRVHGISPSVALPGEEVALAGAGWGAAPRVEFGGVAAQVLAVGPSALRVRVPEVAGGPGTASPVVVVSAAGERSTAAPFVLGRLPLLLNVQPASAAPGDVVTLVGRGFHFRPAANQVRVGERPALVLSASDDELKLVVPFAAAGGALPLDVRVPGSDNMAQASLNVAAPADPVELRFVAEPLGDAAGHDHAVLATGLGPAFVLSASGGRSAANRALAAAGRLNEAAARLKSSIGEDLEARALDSAPALGEVGRPEPLLEATDEDAAAHDEDARRLGAKGPAVTRARLAVWWAAVARDLVLLLARGERPRHAAALAPEGRALGDVFDLARRSGRPGVSRDALAKARPALRESLRLVALRVPAAVSAPAAAQAAAGVASASPPADAFRLDGEWTGEEVENDERRSVTVTFSERGGRLAYQRALTMTLPVAVLDVTRRGSVRYSLQTARGARYYIGSWDGAKLRGRIATDAEGRSAIGSFQLERAR